MKQAKPIDGASAEDERLQQSAGELPLFDSVLAAAIGGASIGGYFGLPGMLVGGLLGGALGYHVNKKSHAC